MLSLREQEEEELQLPGVHAGQRTGVAAEGLEALNQPQLPGTRRNSI